MDPKKCHQKTANLEFLSKSLRPMLLFISLFAVLFCTVSVAESNVMLLEAEDSSIVIPSGAWQVVEDDGRMSIVFSESGDGFEMDFFGTEMSLMIRAGSEDEVVLGMVVDNITKEDVMIDSGTKDYKQIIIVNGLENTDHILKVTLLSGTPYIDKVIMGSPTEIPAPVPRLSEDYYSRASFNRPWILQDTAGTYWITMEVQSGSQNGDIYITKSSDGITWSKPAPVVTGPYHEYDSATVLDDKGEFWMVFTRMEPSENKSVLRGPSKTVNTPYYTHSVDGVTWDVPQRIAMLQDNAYYPYLYYDSEKRVFIYLYASNSVETGEFHDNVYIISSESMSGISGGESLQITEDSMGSSYYPTIVKDNSGEYWLYFVSPKFQDAEVFLNHNDIFVMHSSNPVEWSEPSLVTDADVTVAYNYLHPAYSNGMFYLAIMSSKVLTEDAYIMRSDDGMTFTAPERMVDHDDGRIIDYKSMLADSDGVLWMAYAHVMGDGTRAAYVVNSSDGIVWNAPIRISPESYIFGELWLVSDPKPESVRKLESEAESALVNFPHNANILEDNPVEAPAEDVPQSGFATTLIVILSLLFWFVAKRN